MRKLFSASPTIRTKLSLSISPVTAVLFLFALFYDRSYFVASTLLSAGIHESGHLLMMKWRHVDLQSITIDFLGADIKRKRRECSYATDFVISIGGILANLTAVLLLLPFSFYPTVKLFICCNFVLAAMNALPIRSLDGGEALTSLFLLFLARDYALKILWIISFLSIILLWCIAVYILWFAKGSPSLFFISVYLFGSIFLSSRSEYI